MPHRSNEQSQLRCPIANPWPCKLFIQRWAVVHGFSQRWYSFGDGMLNMRIVKQIAHDKRRPECFDGPFATTEMPRFRAQEVLAIATFHRFLVILEKLLGTGASYRSLRLPEPPEFSAIQINFAFRGPERYDSHVAILGKLIANPPVVLSAFPPRYPVSILRYVAAEVND